MGCMRVCVGEWEILDVLRSVNREGSYEGEAKCIIATTGQILIVDMNNVCVIKLLIFCYVCSSSFLITPWYDLRGWLGAKNQLSIYLLLLLLLLFIEGL